MSFKDCLRILGDINKAMEKRSKVPFDASRWLDGAIITRRFETQIEEYYREKEQEVLESKGLSLSPEYLRIIKGYNNKHFQFFHGMDINDIVNNRAVIPEFKKTLSGKLKSKRNILSALHAFYAWLFEMGRVEQMPAFPKNKGNDADPRKALTPDVQREVLERIPEQFRDPMQFMMETGVRAGECISILVRSVDIGNRLVWIERTRSGSQYRETTKENTKLPVPLNDTALELVKRNIKGKFPMNYLFINPNTGRAYSYKALYQKWKAYSGVDVGMHEAGRHSFCSQIVPLTDSLTAQRLMRHKDKQSTDRYYHAYTDLLLDVVQRKDNANNLKKTNTDLKD
jgi:integrase